jgi:hypothetical protein
VFDGSKASQTLPYQVKTKVTIDAYGYDYSTRLAVPWQAVCHIGVGFLLFI